MMADDITGIPSSGMFVSEHSRLEKRLDNVTQMIVDAQSTCNVIASTLDTFDGDFGDSITLKNIWNMHKSTQTNQYSNEYVQQSEMNNFSGYSSINTTIKKHEFHDRSVQTDDCVLNFDNSQTSSIISTSNKAGVLLCRLCANFVDPDNLISIYDESGRRNEVEKMINSFLPFKVKEMDGYPQHVCSECIKKLWDCYQNYVYFENCSKTLQHLVLANGEHPFNQHIDEVSEAKQPFGDSSNNQNTSNSASNVNGVISVSSQVSPNEVVARRKRKQSHKFLEEPVEEKLSTYVDPSLLDPEHGSGLQVEWCLVNNSPPRQKYTCKRTPIHRGDTQNTTISKKKENLLESSGSSEKRNVKYECSSCTMTFSTQSEAFLHKLKVHPKDIPGVYIHNEKLQKPKNAVAPPKEKQNMNLPPTFERCELCKLSFKNVYGLRIHTSKVHGNKNGNKLPVTSHKISKSTVSEIMVGEESNSLFIRKCPFCPSKFFDISGIENHCEEIHRKYMCMTCEFEFSNKEDCAIHLETHGHNAEGFLHEEYCESISEVVQDSKSKTPAVIYKCPVCTEEFIEPKLLISHQSLHDKQETYECATCGLLFHSKSFLISHVNSHLNESDFECNICKKRFQNPDFLKEHQKIHKKNRHICGICGENFATAKTLEIHSQEIHRNRLPYMCINCGKKYPNEVSLKAHQSIHKKQKGSYVCNVCGKTFFLESNLLRHMVVHPGRRHYKCLVCFKAFKDMRALHKHKAMHLFHRSFICKLCASYFSSFSSLVRHRTEYHSLKEIKEARRQCERQYVIRGINLFGYQCDECDDVFRTKRDLKDHYAVHNTENIFKCQLCDCYYGSQLLFDQHINSHNTSPLEHISCDRSFVTSKALTEHTSPCTKNYSCHYCERKFHSKSLLVMHISSHGNKKFCRPYEHETSMLSHYKSGTCQAGLEKEAVTCDITIGNSNQDQPQASHLNPEDESIKEKNRVPLVKSNSI